VVSGSLLAIAAVFAVVGAVVPDARNAAWGAAAIAVAVALFAVPMLVRRFQSLTGDEDLLANGLRASAILTRIEPTGWRYNRQYPIVTFDLQVQLSGTSLPVRVKQAVAPDQLAHLTVGSAVSVRVDPADHTHVVIAWDQRADHP
jgi:hypothetical protein